MTVDSTELVNNQDGVHLPNVGPGQHTMREQLLNEKRNFEKSAQASRLLSKLKF